MADIYVVYYRPSSVDDFGGDITITLKKKRFLVEGDTVLYEGDKKSCLIFITLRQRNLKPKTFRPPSPPPVP